MDFNGSDANSLNIFFSLVRDVASAHGVRVKIMILCSCPDLSYAWRTDHFFNSCPVVSHAIFWICSTSFPGGNQVGGLPPASSIIL